MARDDTSIQTQNTNDDELQRGTFKLPSRRSLDAARKLRARAVGGENGPTAGVVVDLPDEYVPALLDLSLPRPRVEALRAKWANLGWVKLEGQPVVTGFHAGCEVWVKTREDYDAARQERARNVQSLIRSGLMIGNK